MIRIIGSMLLLLMVFLDSSAQTIPLTHEGRFEVEGRMFHLRDPSNERSIEQLQYAAFKSLQKNESPNYGFDGATHWFKIRVSNQTESNDWLAEVDFAPLDRIDFYIKSDSGWTHKVSGDVLPVSTREIKHRHPLFSFELAQGETKDIYLRIHTTSSIQVPITLWHRDAFMRHLLSMQIVNGLFYGAILIMALYQLFLYFSIRSRVTLFYVLTLAAMANIVAFFQGYTFLYVYPEKPWMNDILAITSGPLFILFAALLTREFLSLRRFSPLLDNILLVNLGLDWLVGALMLAFPRSISYQYHHYFILSHCIFTLLSAAYCLYKKYRPALYYLMAWGTLLLAASMFTVSNLGYLPGYLSTNYSGIMAGCILQMLFIAFALGDRLNVLMRENENVKERELMLRLEENERLEMEVGLRTAKLEEVNRIKDKLFSVVSHDIKGPLASLKLSLSLAKSDMLTPEEFKHVISGIDVHLEQTNEFIQNLLQWAKIQLRGESVEPDRMELMPLVEETVSLLEPDLQQKKIFIDKHRLHGSFVAYADSNMIRSVLRNLLTNAIKFTPAGGVISLSSEMHDHQVTFSVSDTGVGIAPAHAKRIFTLDTVFTRGTKQEMGTGLGLILCREFVEKNNGRIWFEKNGQGAGTTFHISLPEFKDEVKRDPSSR